ncbi:MAG: IPT/TIG domain-containing protein [Prolixibacteraceae bacterium]
MKNIIFSTLMIGLLVFGSSSKSQAQTTYSADEIALNNNDNTELSFVFLTKGSQETIQNTTVAELNNSLIQILSDFENVDTIRTIPAKLEVSPSTGSYLGGNNSDDYFVSIRGGSLGNGWDITSVTLNGVEVSNILIQSSNEVVVIPNAGIPGTGDVVITSKSKGKTVIKNGFTYAVNSSTSQASNL